MDWNLFKRLSGHKNMAGIVVLLTATLLAFSYFHRGGLGVVSAGEEASQIKDQLAIARISTLYALGMDAVGNGLGIEKGAEYLRKGFTEDCVFEIIWPDGSSTDETIGPDAWAAFAAQAFEGTYTNTNHLMGTYDIEVKGNTATMSTHLNATHVRYDGSVDYAEGVYYDDCVRVGGGWKSYHRALHFISFNNFIPEFSLIPPPPEP